MIRSFLILFLFQSITLYTQTAIWNGGGDGVSWADGGNWELEIPPAIGDSVVIAVDSVVLEGTDPTMKNLLLQNGAKLMIHSSLIFSGSDSYAIRADNSSLINKGKIIIKDAGSHEFADRAVELLNESFFHNENVDAVLDIEETRGYGIWVHSGSIFENDGLVSVLTLDRAGIVVINANSGFINRDHLNITGQGIFSNGIDACGSGHFTNLGEILIYVSNYNSGLSVFSGGTLVNESSIIINAESANGIFISGNSSQILQQDGNIEINLTTSNGIYLEGGKLRIDSGAEIQVNSPPVDYYLHVDPDAIMDCQGIFDIG